MRCCPAPSSAPRWGSSPGRRRASWPERGRPPIMRHAERSLDAEPPSTPPTTRPTTTPTGRPTTGPRCGYYTRLVAPLRRRRPVPRLRLRHRAPRAAPVGARPGDGVRDVRVLRRAPPVRNAPGPAVHHQAPTSSPSASFGALTAIHVLEHLTDDVARRDPDARGGASCVPVGTPSSSCPTPPGAAGASRARRGWASPTRRTSTSSRTPQWREFLTAHGFAVEREGSDGLWDVPYSRLPKLLDAGVHAVPAFVQFLSGGWCCDRAAASRRCSCCGATDRQGRPETVCRFWMSS